MKKKHSKLMTTFPFFHNFFLMFQIFQLTNFLNGMRSQTNLLMCIYIYISFLDYSNLTLCRLSLPLSLSTPYPRLQDNSPKNLIFF